MEKKNEKAVMVMLDQQTYEKLKKVADLEKRAMGRQAALILEQQLAAENALEKIDKIKDKADGLMQR